MLLLKKKKTSNVTIESNIDFRLILTCSLKFQYIWVSWMTKKWSDSILMILYEPVRFMLTKDIKVIHVLLWLIHVSKTFNN